MIGKLNILNVIRREKFKAYYPFFSQNIQSGIIIAGGAAHLGSKTWFLSIPLYSSFKHFCDKKSVANAIGFVLSYLLFKG